MSFRLPKPLFHPQTTTTLFGDEAGGRSLAGGDVAIAAFAKMLDVDRGQTAKRPKPYCHAATKAAQRKFREMRKAWIDAYTQAADRFRRGILEAIGEFPDNAYLPRFGRLPDVPRKTLELVPDTS